MAREAASRRAAQAEALTRALEEAQRGLREALRDTEQARQRAVFLADAGAVLAGSLDYEHTLQQVARLAVPALADWCSVDVLQEDGSIRGVGGAHVDVEKEPLLRDLQRRYPPDLAGTRPISVALRTRQAVLYAEVDGDTLAATSLDADHLALRQHLGVASVMVAPLVARGQLLGAIMFVAGVSGRRYGPGDLVLAEELARRAALAVASALHYRAEQTARAAAEAALRARDAFLSVAAHELKTPLTSLWATAQLLRQRLQRTGPLEPERVDQALRRIDGQSRRLARLVGHLFDVGRLEAGHLTLQPEATDLRRLIEDVVAAAQATTERHRIRVLAAAPLVAMVDPLRLEQVVGDLLDNAIKYSPAGGAIEVEVARCRPARDGGAVETARAVGSASPPPIRIAVRDHGLGIPPEHRARLFERFYQAHAGQHASGLGLGLFLCQQIVECHGGRITVEFPEDGGSRFIVTLPAAAALPTTASAA